jgi:hypothetical protein
MFAINAMTACNGVEGSRRPGDARAQVVRVSLHAAWAAFQIHLCFGSCSGRELSLKGVGRPVCTGALMLTCTDLWAKVCNATA